MRENIEPWQFAETGRRWVAIIKEKLPEEREERADSSTWFGYLKKNHIYSIVINEAQFIGALRSV